MPIQPKNHFALAAAQQCPSDRKNSFKRSGHGNSPNTKWFHPDRAWLFVAKAARALRRVGYGKEWLSRLKKSKIIGIVRSERLRLSRISALHPEVG